MFPAVGGFHVLAHFATFYVLYGQYYWTVVRKTVRRQHDAGVKYGVTFQLVARDSLYGYVQCTITYKRAKIRFSIGESRITAALWNDKKQELKGQSQAALSVNDRKDEIKRKALKWFKDGNTDLAELKLILQGGMPKGSASGARALFEDFMRAHESVYSSGTVSAYTTTSRSLESYEIAVGRRLDLRSFRKGTEKLESEAVALGGDLSLWLSEVKKYNDNTRSKALAHLTTVLKWHKKTGKAGAVELHTDFADKKAIRKEESLALTKDEMLAIESVVLVKDSTEWHVRNGFLLGCYTGLRFSDWNRVDPSLWKERLQILVQKKTGGTVSVLHTDQVRTILSHYADSGWPHCIANSNNNVQVNRHIKVIAAKAGLTRPWSDVSRVNGKNIVVRMRLCDAITSHTSRRTFVTLQMLENVPESDIMRRTGHSKLSSLRGYDRTTSEQLADKYGVKKHA